MSGTRKMILENIQHYQVRNVVLIDIRRIDFSRIKGNHRVRAYGTTRLQRMFINHSLFFNSLPSYLISKSYTSIYFLCYTCESSLASIFVYTKFPLLFLILTGHDVARSYFLFSTHENKSYTLCSNNYSNFI